VRASLQRFRRSAEFLDEHPHGHASRVRELDFLDAGAAQRATESFPLSEFAEMHSIVAVQAANGVPAGKESTVRLFLETDGAVFDHLRFAHKRENAIPRAAFLEISCIRTFIPDENSGAGTGGAFWTNFFIFASNQQEDSESGYLPSEFRSVQESYGLAASSL